MIFLRQPKNLKTLLKSKHIYSGVGILKIMKSIVSVFLVFVLILMSSCTPTTSNLITALNAVADASSVAVIVTQSLVALGKVSPDVANQVSVYAQGVDQAVTTSIAELNSNDTNPVKITNISAAFAKVAAPAFGNNAPLVVTAIGAVTVAIDIFLRQLNSSQVLAAAKGAPTVAPSLTMTRGNKAMLKNISKKVAETQAVALKLKQ